MDEPAADEAAQPEGPGAGVPLGERDPGVAASVGRRAVAIIVDTFLIWFVAYLFAVSSDSQVGYSALGFKFGQLGNALLLLGALAYFVILEGLFGATVGKAITGIRVRSDDGARAGWAAVLLRNVLRIVDILPCFPPYLLGAAFAWNTERRKRVGDLAAHTVVEIHRP